MKVDVISPGAFAAARIQLEAGEEFVSEAGAMVRMSGSISSEVTTKPKGSKGGIMAGLKRMLGGDSFFMSTYHADQPGEVVIAPTLPGDCYVLQLDGGTEWICAGASYLGSGTEVSLDTQFQGMKGFLTGESIIFMKVSGHGPVVVNAFGKIREVEVDGDYIIDTGHVVAYQDTMKYTITKAGSSWISSYLSGEGFVMNFSGKGKVLVQSHNPSEFGQSIGPKLRPRKG